VMWDYIIMIAIGFGSPFAFFIPVMVSVWIGWGTSAPQVSRHAHDAPEALRHRFYRAVERTAKKEDNRRIKRWMKL
jgi:hypothetical protein